MTITLTIIAAYAAMAAYIGCEMYRAPLMGDDYDER